MSEHGPLRDCMKPKNLVRISAREAWGPHARFSVEAESLAP